MYVLIGPLLGKIIGNAQDAPLEIKCRDGRSQQAYQLKSLHRVDPQVRPRTPKFVSSRKSWSQKMCQGPDGDSWLSPSVTILPPSDPIKWNKISHEARDGIETKPLGRNLIPSFGLFEETIARKRVRSSLNLFQEREAVRGGFISNRNVSFKGPLKLGRVGSSQQSTEDVSDVRRLSNLAGTRSGPGATDY